MKFHLVVASSAGQSFRDSSMAEAKRSRSEGMETFAVLIRGQAFCFDLWMRFGCSRIILATRKWSVLQSAL